MAWYFDSEWNFVKEKKYRVDTPYWVFISDESSSESLAIYNVFNHIDVHEDYCNKHKKRYTKSDAYYRWYDKYYESMIEKSKAYIL